MSAASPIPSASANPPSPTIIGHGGDIREDGKGLCSSASTPNFSGHASAFGTPIGSRSRAPSGSESDASTQSSPDGSRRTSPAALLVINPIHPAERELQEAEVKDLRGRIFSVLKAQKADITIVKDENDIGTIIEADSKTKFSLISEVGKDKAINALLLAREGQDSFENKAERIRVIAIEHLFVGLDYRRRKYATQMLHVVAERAVKVQADEIRLLCVKENVKALKMYQKFGFEHVDKAKDEKFPAWLFKVNPNVLFEKTRTKK